MDTTQYTPVELAEILDNTVFGASTGALSLLDEVTLKWATVHPELDVAQREFALARGGWWPGDPRRDTPEAWARVVGAAAALAEQMRQYGDERLPVCGRPDQWGGECRGVALANGRCTYGSYSHPDES